MSRILKRPMFRKGGEVMEGIMTGIKPRQNFNQGKSVQDRFESYQKLLSSVAPTTPAVDPLAKFLISGGLKGFSTTGGTTLQNLAKAYEGPTQQLFTDIEAQKKPRQAMNLLAGELAIKGDIEVEKAKADKNAKIQQANFVGSLYDQKIDKVTQAINALTGKTDQQSQAALENLEKERRSLETIKESMMVNVLVPGKSQEELILDAARALVSANLVASYEEAINQARASVQSVYQSTTFTPRTNEATGGPQQSNTSGIMGIYKPTEVSTANTLVRNENQMGQPSVDMPLTEFRRKIPAEISDDIVTLIYYNQEAFADFANIKTQNDVDSFNNKYEVQLVLPFETKNV